MKLKIYEKGKEGEKHKYFSLKYGPHDKYEIIIWIASAIAFRAGDEIDFPLTNHRFHVTKNNGLILVPSNEDCSFIYKVKSGYRGSADFTVNPPENLLRPVIKNYHSPVGNLGEDAIGIINVYKDKPVDVTWKISGRHVDKTNGWVRLTPDGEETELLMDDELESFLLPPAVGGDK